MKKLLVAALLAVSVAGSAFATNTKMPDTKISKAFSKQFTHAEGVQWAVTSDYTKATFTEDSRKVEVYYDRQGELIGTSRAIAVEELPVTAKRAFAKRYTGYTVTEAIRFEGTNETGYYISAENEKESVILKVDENDNVSVFKQKRK